MGRTLGSKNKKKPAAKKVGSPKGSKKKVKKTKKKVGRPKGSKNRLKKIKKKAGRPKGSKNRLKKIKKVKKVEKVKKVKKTKVKGKALPESKSQEPEYVPPKAFKFKGYCPKCKGMVGTSDMISKFIYVCISCGKRARIKTLKEKRKSSNVFYNKKEYLDVSMAMPHDTPPLHDKEEIKNIEISI